MKMGVWDEEEGFWAGREDGGEDERLCRRLEGAFRKMVKWWREKLVEAEKMGEGKKSCRYPDVDFWRMRDGMSAEVAGDKGRGEKGKGGEEGGSGKGEEGMVDEVEGGWAQVGVAEGVGKEGGEGVGGGEGEGGRGG